MVYLPTIHCSYAHIGNVFNKVENQYYPVDCIADAIALMLA